MKLVRLSASRTGRLYPQECSWYTFSLGAESTPGPWYGRKNPLTPTGIDPGTVRLVAQRLNHYATTGPTFHLKTYYLKILLDLGRSKVPEDPVPVGFCSSRIWACICLAIHVHIRKEFQLKSKIKTSVTFGSSRNALSHALSSSNILPQRSSHFSFIPTGKNSELFQRYQYFNFFFKLCNLKFPMSESVYILVFSKTTLRH